MWKKSNKQQWKNLTSNYINKFKLLNFSSKYNWLQSLSESQDIIIPILAFSKLFQSCSKLKPSRNLQALNDQTCPFSPTMAMRSPSLTFMITSFRIHRSPNFSETSRSWITGMVPIPAIDGLAILEKKILCKIKIFHAGYDRSDPLRLKHGTLLLLMMGSGELT